MQKKWVVGGVFLCVAAAVVVGCPFVLGIQLAVSAHSHHFAQGETTWTFQVWNDLLVGDPVNFTVAADQAWIQVNPTTGTSNRAPITGAPDKVTITVTIDPRAKCLRGEPPNAGVITITSASGGVKKVYVTAAPDYFTELFETTPPLQDKTFTFVPNGSPNFYCAAQTDAAAFPTDPTPGTVLTFDDDGNALVTPAQPVPFYGVNYTSLFVSQFGYITFGDEPDAGVPNETLGEHFAAVRISALPEVDASLGGMVSAITTDADKVVITFQDVPGTAKQADINNFQVELFYDGTVTITYIDINVPDAVIGLSFGPRVCRGGIPDDFVPSDFTAYNTDCLAIGN